VASPDRDIDEDEESQKIALKTSTPVKLTAVERASRQKVIRGIGLNETMDVQADGEFDGPDKSTEATATSNDEPIGQTTASAPKRRPIKSSSFTQKKKTQTKFAVQYEDEVDVEVPAEAARNVDRHTSKRLSGTPDFERAPEGHASPALTPPEDIPDTNIHDQTIVPETQPSQPSISADTRLRDSPQAPAKKALAPVPDISPSKFAPYLSQSAESTSSPVEEFSPTKRTTQSALESISDEFTHTQRSRNTKLSSSMPNTQQSKAVEPPTFDRITLEAFDVFQASKSPEGTPQTLQRMEEEFVDYDGGHEEGFGLVPESQMAGVQAEVEFDEGQHIPTPEMTHSPVAADPSQLQIDRNSPRLSATGSNKVSHLVPREQPCSYNPSQPASIPANAIHPRLQVSAFVERSGDTLTLTLVLYSPLEINLPLPHHWVGLILCQLCRKALLAWSGERGFLRDM
jgi:hypothetical protein